MCDLCSVTTNRAAIAAQCPVLDRYVGNLAPMSAVFPDYPAPGANCFLKRFAVEFPQGVVMRTKGPVAAALMLGLIATSASAWAIKRRNAF
jgi:hypothetical protein